MFEARTMPCFGSTLRIHAMPLELGIAFPWSSEVAGRQHPRRRVPHDPRIAFPGQLLRTGSAVRLLAGSLPLVRQGASQVADEGGRRVQPGSVVLGDAGE